MIGCNISQVVNEVTFWLLRVASRLVFYFALYSRISLPVVQVEKTLFFRFCNFSTLQKSVIQADREFGRSTGIINMVAKIDVNAHRGRQAATSATSAIAEVAL